MSFSEKRKQRQRNDLMRKIIEHVDKYKTISIKPKTKGWPRFNVDDLHWLEKALEPAKINMLGYCAENFQENGTIQSNKDGRAIAWVSFGRDANLVWLNHLEQLENMMEAITDLLTDVAKTKGKISAKLDAQAMCQEMIDHAEICRLDWIEKTGCNAQPFSYKTHNSSLN